MLHQIIARVSFSAEQEGSVPDVQDLLEEDHEASAKEEVGIGLGT